VVGVDCVLDGEIPALVTPVVAKGEALPFRSAVFEYTVCMDTLEHVNPSARSAFVRELIRVTKRRLYLGCPMGARAEHEDRGMQRYYAAHRGQSFPFLDEHVAYGLPRLERVVAEMERVAALEGRPISIRCEPNLNVWVHRLLLRLWIRTDRISYALHRLAVALVHVRHWLNLGPCYRQMIVAEFAPRPAASGLQP
jgi:ubiquinone/menaquinone biosynthesis C-methylase UbiE